MYRRIFSVIILVVLLFSLCACNKNEEPKDVPETEPSEITPIAKDEPKEAPVKEFSDGRLYVPGDIISFCETENYYFTLDKDASGLYISCFTKDGQLVKRAQPRGISIVLGNPTKEDLNQEVTFVPATDIYAVKNDSIVFGCAGGNNRYILMNSDFECDVITGKAFPDLNYYDAAFLKNDEGYYDVLTLGDTDLLYRFNSQRMTSTHNFEFLDYSHLSKFHNTWPQTAFTAEDGSIYSFGSLDAMDENGSMMIQQPVIAKFSENIELVASKVYPFEYGSLFDAVLVGEFVVFAQEVYNRQEDKYINRLMVLDKDLNELFTKDYIGSCPVEVQAAGENLAVSVYKYGGKTGSFIEILSKNGEQLQIIEHSLSYARLLSDKSEGFYVSGKQGTGSVNTVLRHYNKDVQLIDETFYNTEFDYDNGFGLYFEINNAGEPVAIQGNIENFPLNLTDLTVEANRFERYENYFEDTLFIPPSIGELPIIGNNKQMVFEGEYITHIRAENKVYMVTCSENGYYLNAFDSSNKRLWQIGISDGCEKLYYAEGNLIVLNGRIMSAFDAQTGEQQWYMWLDDRIYPDSVEMVNNKLYYLVSTGDRSCFCVIDAAGNWEYVPIPTNFETEFHYNSLKKDALTDALYCVASNETQNIIVKLNDKFEVVASHIVEDIYFSGYFINNGRIYVSVSELDRNTRYFYIQLLDNSLNLLTTLETTDHWYYISSVDDTTMAVQLCGITYLVDVDGNIIKQLAGASNAIMVHKTDTGYEAIARVINNTYKICEYDKDLKLISITPCEIDTLIEKFPDMFPAIA